MSNPGASVLILTWNGMVTLPGAIDALRKQRFATDYELVAVDSGSTDGTLALLERHADRVLQVRPEAFQHGDTRNLGVEACRGERVALLVQDAVPAGADWLERLVAPLDEAGVAGASSRQQARADARAITRRSLERWVAAAPSSRRTSLDVATYDRLTPAERLERCAFDNVSSALDKDVWREHPFPSRVIAEDLAWAKEVLLAGYSLAYAADSLVTHSHDRGLRYELARTRQLHEQLHHLFGMEAIGSVEALLRAVAKTLPEHLRCLGEDIRSGRAPWRDLLRVPGLAVAWPLGQYLGARRARLGASPRRVRGV